MIRNIRLLAFLGLASALPILSQLPYLPTPLPTPLKLPPGNVEVLQIDHEGSYMGDAIRVVDCPNSADEPFGTCGNTLFGGVGMWNSHLKGAIQITFSTPVNGITHFQVTHPFNLTGDDTTMVMPSLYTFPITQNTILDTFDNFSSGDLNLNTGEVLNMNYNVIFFNLWYGAFGQVNPLIKPPSFSFQETFPPFSVVNYYGSAVVNFAQRPDGKLDFTFYGTEFLPLGSSVNGDPVRVPLVMTGPTLPLGNITAPGLSLHPHLRITTVPNTDPPCGNVCIPVTPNSVIQMVANPRFSVIGDDYSLNIPQLGVPPGAPKPEGHSSVMGTVIAQFGALNGNYIPVALRSVAPTGLLVPPPPFPEPGLSLGFFGADTHLLFPAQTYNVQGVVVIDDPFDYAVGDMDIRTGQIIGGLSWHSFWNHTLITAVLQSNGGALPIYAFQQRGPAQFQLGPNSQIMFRFSSQSLLYFTNFKWPTPDYTNLGAAYLDGPNSFAEPFVRIQASLPTDTPTQVMAGGQQTAKSTYGETFSYQYSIPCSGSGTSPSFTYTNGGEINPDHKGTFTMTKLSFVSCINSLQSTASSGNYDDIQFAGYGTWSGDSNPHIAHVNISTNPNAPYVSVLIDAGSVSNADIAPVVAPTP